jgi:5-methylcytosine-specific restriction endonuclease McrA
LPIACKKEILAALYPKCWICRLPFADHPHLQRTIDHFLPRSKGGDDSLDNLRYAHCFCNRCRGNMVGTPTNGFRANCRSHTEKVLRKLARIRAGLQLEERTDGIGCGIPTDLVAPSPASKGGQS